MSKLTVEQIEVPDFMLAAATARGYSLGWQRVEIRAILAYSLLALAENPIVPCPEDTKHLYGYNNQYDKRGFENHPDPTMAAAMVEWQRRMFLKREPELPAEVKALMMRASDIHINQSADNEREANARILKAYELGKAGA